jgi:peptidoglycan hydrolase-like protein with peptidoglycan-binding domain
VDVPFGVTVELGTRGKPALAVKRALSRAGYIKWGAFTPLFGPFAARSLKSFQKAEGLEVDGVVGPATLAKLAASFKAYEYELYVGWAPGDRRAAFLRIADLTVQHSGLLSYTEAIGEAPGQRDWFRVAPIDTTGANWTDVVQAHGKLTADCSGHYYGCAYHAGIAIPQPDGATGALLGLVRISLGDALPGDGVIWTGAAAPAGHHITILRARRAGGDWDVVNHGGPDGTGPSRSTLSAQDAYQRAAGYPTKTIVRLPA